MCNTVTQAKADVNIVAYDMGVGGILLDDTS